MYSRYPNYRFGSGVRVPENYSGNAFGTAAEEKESAPLAEETDPALESVPEDTPASQAEGESTPQEADESAIAASAIKRKGFFKLPSFSLSAEKLFGGFGFEELLIVALIFLISQQGKDDDIILFLALLLFVG